MKLWLLAFVIVAATLAAITLTILFPVYAISVIGVGVVAVMTKAIHDAVLVPRDEAARSRGGDAGGA